MNDPDTHKLTGYSDASEVEQDEYHSALEIDDTSGWKVLIVPGLAVLFLIGAIVLFFVSTNDTAPDPRVQAQIRAKEEQKQKQRESLGAPAPASTQYAPPPEVPAQNQAAPAQ